METRSQNGVSKENGDKGTSPLQENGGETNDLSGNHVEECPSEGSETQSWLLGAITTIKGVQSSSPTRHSTFEFAATQEQDVEMPSEREEQVKNVDSGTGSDLTEDTGYAQVTPDHKSKPKTHVLWAAPLVTELDSNSVTVKFVLGPGKVFTRAYKIYCNIKEIKEDLSSVFKVPVDILCLTKEGESLEESLPLAGMGIEPYGTVELVLNTLQPEKYPLSTNNIYEEFSIPDVLTVRIETDKDDYREIVVEIENRSIRKPFLGGYRHKHTGVEYHHAFSQTQPRLPSVPPESRWHRDTQTAQITDRRQNTLSNKSTQILKQDHEIPSVHDKIITARKYVTSEEVEGTQVLEEKVRTIQRNWRAYKIRTGIHRMSSAYRKYKIWESKEKERMEEERRQFQKQDLARKTFPCTKSDFAMLYNMVERWRTKEMKRIAEMKPEAPKKAEFCALLEEEIRLLTAIEEHRIKLKEERLEKKDLQLINKCAEPVIWTGYKGLNISMDTVYTQRARELKELYQALCQENVSLEERLEILFSIKCALKSYNTKWGNDIILLLERESELLLIGLKKDELSVLRKRIKKLFVEFMKDPEFNPQMAKYLKSYNMVDVENKMFYCERCCKLLPYTFFPVDTRLKVIKYCASCTWIENISGPRIDLGPYKNILRAVRREEQKRRCHSSVAFVMQEQDIYFLIVDIWQAHSAINECRDINQLRLPRWDISKDWSPWNCILVTDDEMKYHNALDNLEQSYEPDFIAEVKNKHTLAKIHFHHLAKTDHMMQESGDWTAIDKGGIYVPHGPPPP